MKVSENWIRTFVAPALTSAELADALTMAGLEVEENDPAAPPFTGVVVGKVLAVDKHPNANRLTVCRVDVGGSEPLQIVCGAPNATAGARVPVAIDGARLPAIEVKKTTVRGVESQGMLCSARELGISTDAAGLLILDGDAAVGIDIRRHLDLDDRIFDVNLTPNRGDCLSAFGIAREVAAITGATLRAPAPVKVTAEIADRIEIVLEDAAGCPRYCGRIVRGIDPRARTPDWMLRRLERAGLRGLGAVVDITNYVMLELGQPLHAFDRARIDGAIRVRRGRGAEKLRLLNEQVVELTSNLLVIADDRKALALAGIMGGADSAVAESTRDILLESAFFTPGTIAGRARLLGFGSDAAFRFERGVDFGNTAQAIDYATRLLLDICGGRAGPVCEALAALPARNPVTLRRSRASRVLGIELSNEQVEDVLGRLQFKYERKGEQFTVTPPSYRFDISIEEDLIEEVARIHGYDNIPADVPVAGASMLPAAETRRGTDDVREILVMRGYQEIVSYSFVERQWESDFCANEDPVALKNPIAEQMSVMRSSMIGSLVDRLRFNLNYKHNRVRLFEIGRCFAREGEGYRQTTMVGGIAQGDALPEQWGAASRNVDFYDVKSDLEALLAPAIGRYEPSQHPAFHPLRCARVTMGGRSAGWIGELHPGLVKKYNIPYAPIAFEVNLNCLLERALPAYREISRYPLVRRDLAVVIDEKVSHEQILAALRGRCPAIISEIGLFDVYRGKGIDSDKKSLAFRLFLQDTRKTLTDAEVDTAVSAVVQVLQEEFRATLRV